MKEFGELMRAIDEDLDHCIQKFRNATSGHDARIFVSEYEELSTMFSITNLFFYP